MPFPLTPEARVCLPSTSAHPDELQSSTSLQEAVRASSNHFAAQLCSGKLAERSSPRSLAAPPSPTLGPRASAYCWPHQSPQK